MMRDRRRRALAGALVALLALGCGDAPDPHGRGEEHAGHAEDEAIHAVRLDAEARAEFGIELEAAGPGWIERSVSLPGEVRPNQDRLAHIAPRFAGIVREVHADIGDAVKPGQKLAIVESEALAPFALQTLIGGVVIAKHITRGEPVSRERAAFVVADLRDVWVDISVYQKDLPLARVGSPVRISAGHGLQEAEGEISYVSPIVDEATRTATARVVLPNPDGVWRPGLFVTARIRAERTEVPVAVPEGALHEVEGKPVVFVEEADVFSLREVTPGRRGGGRVEITHGLEPGERYAARGGFLVKAELSRGQISGGHAH
jgi:cobalt-zinc-cadmium efflux system membrane fusion protein